MKFEELTHIDGILDYIENYKGPTMFVWSSHTAPNDFILLLADGKEYIRINYGYIIICGSSLDNDKNFFPIKRDEYNSIIRKIEDFNNKTILELTQGNVNYV